MTHGTDGKIFCRVSHTWMTPEEHARAYDRVDEAAFMRTPNQGALAAPAVISDSQGGIRGVKSMADGKQYDSKSEMRKAYKRAGMIEVGNDSSVSEASVRDAWAPHKRPETAAQRDERLKGIEYDVQRSISQTNLTSYRHEEIN